jgi:ubiquinone/menaquinone biosynthesis C-methylase UbiE
MLPFQSRWSDEESRLAQTEQAQRDAEAGSYDRLPGLHLLTPLEIPSTLGPLSAKEGSRVVEIGCGTGRLTLPLMDRGATVVAMDHSLESLRRLRSKLGESGSERLQLVQADATRQPVRDDWATHALAAQMIEHVPSAAMRKAVIGELARSLEPGGRLAISGYYWVPFLRGLLRREGAHSGKMYYRRFTKSEFIQMLTPEFEVERLTGRLLYALLAHASKRADPKP